MGVAGGALATVLGQALSLVMVLYYLFRTRIRTIRLTAASLHPPGHFCVPSAPWVFPPF